MSVSLRYPFVREQLEPLRAGDLVQVTGFVVTGRDRLHRYLAEGGVSPVSLRDAAIFHCGPVVVRKGGGWVIQAAGPTTSMREEPFMGTVMERQGIRVIVGKGGMGRATVEACRRLGGVYLEAVGGAAQVLARAVRRVMGVHFLKEFGAAEAMWLLEVEDFPALVGIDIRGNNLHEAVEVRSRHALQALLRENPIS